MATDKHIVAAEPDRGAQPVNPDVVAAQRVRAYLDGPVSLAETARAHAALAALDTAIRDLAAAHGISEDVLADRLVPDSAPPRPPQ